MAVQRVIMTLLLLLFHQTVLSSTTLSKSDDSENFQTNILRFFTTSIPGSVEINKMNDTNVNASLQNSEEPSIEPQTTTELSIHDDTTKFKNSSDEAIFTKDVNELGKSMGITTDKPVMPDVCYEYGTCGFVSSLSFQYCSCDELCSVYSDCCIDSHFKNTSLASEMSQYLECSRYSDTDKYIGMFVVKHCPVSMRNTEIDGKCRNDDLLSVGPWVVGNSGYIYQNIYCLKCHGQVLVDVFSIKLSNVPMQYINNNTNTNQIYQLEQIFNPNTYWRMIQKELIPPEGTHVRKCLLYESQNVENVECENYPINPVIKVGSRNIEIYQNHFCIPNDTRLSLCLGPHIGSFGRTGSLYNIYPLSIIFPFQQNDIDCETKVLDICLEENTFKDYPVSLILSIETSTQLPVKIQLQLLLMVTWSLTSDITLYQIGMAHTTKRSNTSFINEATIDVLITKQMKEKEMNEYVDRIRSHNWEVVMDTPENRHLDQVRVYMNNIREMSMFLTYTYAFKTDLPIEMKNENITIMANSSRICEKYFLEVEVHETTAASNMVFNNVKCSKETLVRTQEKPAIRIQTIITYTGMGISVISLTCSLVVYRKTGMYKSVPGSNVENLSISLQIFNILFMIGAGANDIQVLCYMVGAVLHYLLLLVFAFMSIAMVYMSNSFVTLRNNKDSNCKTTLTRQRFLTLLGLTIPAFIVIPSVILDKVFGLIKIYSSYMCFPTGYLGNLIFVSAPIGVSILINLVCFGCIAVIITKNSYSHHFKKSSSLKHVYVFARISVISGVFWISGLLAVIVPTEMTEYIFITFCSLQGFFIALAFLSTRRIAQMAYLPKLPTVVRNNRNFYDTRL